MFAFVVLVIAGTACSIVFVRPWGPLPAAFLPSLHGDSFHFMLLIHWFFVACVGITIFWLIFVFKTEPEGLSVLIEFFFAACAFVAVGGTVDIPSEKPGLLDG